MCKPGQIAEVLLWGPLEQLRRSQRLLVIPQGCRAGYIDVQSSAFRCQEACLPLRALLFHQAVLVLHTHQCWFQIKENFVVFCTMKNSLYQKGDMPFYFTQVFHTTPLYLWFSACFMAELRCSLHICSSFWDPGNAQEWRKLWKHNSLLYDSQLSQTFQFHATSPHVLLWTSNFCR